MIIDYALGFLTVATALCLTFGCSDIYVNMRKTTKVVTTSRISLLKSLPRKFLFSAEEQYVRLIQAELDTNEKSFNRVLLARTLLAIVLPSSSLFLLSVAFVTQISIMIILSIVGFYMPSWYFSVLINRRRKIIKQNLPDVMNLLLICADAGLNIESSLRRVTAEIQEIFPELSNYLRSITLEINAGRSREQALRNWADFTQIEEARNLVNLLNQSLAFGTPLYESLAILIDDIQQRQLLFIEEKINKLSIKMSMILITCFLPALVILLISPVVYHLYNSLIVMGGFR